MYLFMCNVPFRYMRSCLSFPQSSSSCYFTLVAKKETSVSTCGIALMQRNRSCGTVWWNCLACSSASCNRFLAFLSLNSKRLSLVGDSYALLETSECYYIIFCRHFIIDRITLSGSVSKSISVHRYSCILPQLMAIFGPQGVASFSASVDILIPPWGTPSGCSYVSRWSFTSCSPSC